MKAVYDETLATALKRKHESQGFVGNVLKAEISEKQARSIKYQLTVAQLPLAEDVDDFAFKNTPINEALVRDAGCGFIAQQRNVVLVGGTGTGKTHLASHRAKLHPSRIARSLLHHRRSAFVLSSPRAGHKCRGAPIATNCDRRGRRFQTRGRIVRAIRVHKFGGVDTMRLDELPRPVPGPNEVLVAVKAAGVGPWDRLAREGRISQALPLTLGSEVSGTVVALGADVGVFALGDAVYGATNDQFVGGYAEYALVEAGKIAPKPAALDYVTAAGLPVVAVTAWQMLFEYARIEPGQAILVRGAAGSVGACATQIAKDAGATVYGTARAPDVERVQAQGAEPVVESDRVGAQLASRSLDAVIDTIGGDALESTHEVLHPNGIIVSVVRAPDEAAMVERGTLNLRVGEVLDLADASSAHRMLDGASHKPGKIVLRVPRLTGVHPASPRASASSI